MRRIPSFLAVVLCAVLILSQAGCTASNEEQAITSTLTASAVAAMQLYAAESGTTYNETLGNQIIADGQLFMVFFNEWDANPNATAWQKVLNEAQTLQTDITQTLTAFHVTNPASQNKISAIVTFVLGQLNAWLPIAAGTQNASPVSSAALYAHFIEVSAKLPRAKQPKTASQYAAEFNKLLAVKTGNSAGDSKSGQLKIHNHSAPVRIVTFGVAK